MVDCIARYVRPCTLLTALQSLCSKVQAGLANDLRVHLSWALKIKRGPLCSWDLSKKGLCHYIVLPGACTFHTHTTHSLLAPGLF